MESTLTFFMNRLLFIEDPKADSLNARRGKESSDEKKEQQGAEVIQDNAKKLSDLVSKSTQAMREKFSRDKSLPSLVPCRKDRLVEGKDGAKVTDDATKNELKQVASQEEITEPSSEPVPEEPATKSPPPGPLFDKDLPANVPRFAAPRKPGGRGTGGRVSGGRGRGRGRGGRGRGGRGASRGERSGRNPGRGSSRPPETG